MVKTVAKRCFEKLEDHLLTETEAGDWILDPTCAVAPRTYITLASFNVRGVTQTAKRTILDQLATKCGIRILALQECKINANCRKVSDDFYWYFGSVVTAAAHAKIAGLRDTNCKIDTQSRIAAQEHLEVGIMVHKS